MIKLNAQHLMSKLNSESLSLIEQIDVFNELDSTNEYLLKQKGCGEVCLAETQTRGRGRRGRSWSSPDAGNIYLSMSWCFEEIPEQFQLISLITGISLCEVLDSFGLQGHGIKWPNDLLINKQKIAGILVETSGNLNRIVIGIGLNLHSLSISRPKSLGSVPFPSNTHKGRHKENTVETTNNEQLVTKTQTNRQAKKQLLQEEIQQPWCSLEDVLKEVPQRNDVIIGIINNLTKKLSTLSSLSFSEFIHQWNQWDSVIGRPVTIIDGEKLMNGVAKGLDKNGHILVKLENNRLQSFHSAEVSLRC